MYIPHFVYSFMSWGTLGLFLLLDIIDNAAMKTGIQVSCLSPCFPFFWYLPRSGIAYYMVILCLHFEGTAKLLNCFLHKLHYSTFPPPLQAMHLGSSSPSSCQHLGAKWYFTVSLICISLHRGWDGWMVSLTQWTCVWVDSGSWWWTGRPGVLWLMESQRVGHDWVSELNWMTNGVRYLFMCLWPNL